MLSTPLRSEIAGGVFLCYVQTEISVYWFDGLKHILKNNVTQYLFEVQK